MEVMTGRAEGLLMMSDPVLSSQEREQVREQVRLWARRWALRNSRTWERERYTRMRVMAILGVATQAEEVEVLYRSWRRPQTGWFQPG